MVGGYIMMYKYYFFIIWRKNKSIGVDIFENEFFDVFILFFVFLVFDVMFGLWWMNTKKVLDNFWVKI